MLLCFYFVKVTCVHCLACANVYTTTTVETRSNEFSYTPCRVREWLKSFFARTYLRSSVRTTSIRLFARPIVRAYEANAFINLYSFFPVSPIPTRPPSPRVPTRPRIRIRASFFFFLRFNFY